MLKVRIQIVVGQGLLALVCVGCFGSSDGRSAAELQGFLPEKSTITPNGVDYDLSGVTSTIPDDSSYNSHQSSVMYAVRAHKAWERQTDCSSTRIGIVDSGIDATHPDFFHPDTSSNLRDVSGSGTPKYGKDFVSSSSTAHPIDENSHGTHVAGIIGAAGDNAQGISGICWKADMLIAKVTDEKGSAFLSDVVDGMDYVLTTGARVVNASLGSYVPSTTESEHASFEDVFSSVTSKAESQGAIIVAAAGNSGADTDVNRTYPASLESSSILSVAANLEGVGSQLLFSSSNYGGGTVHLSAPGYGIYSTIPTVDYYYDEQASNPASPKNYGSKTGTSMAAPMVSGTLALMWSNIKDRSQSITGSNLVSLLLNNVETHPGALGVPGNGLITGGFLDVGAAVEAAKEY